MRIWRLVATLSLSVQGALLSAEADRGGGTELGPARAVRGPGGLLPALRRAAALQVPSGGRVPSAGRAAPQAAASGPPEAAASRPEDTESSARRSRAAEKRPRAEDESRDSGPRLFYNGATLDRPDKGDFGGFGAATLDKGDLNLDAVLKQLKSIQDDNPKNIVILGTQQCSYFHQQIVELLAYALVLSNNHLYTSGGTGTHAAAIRGALRAESPDLLTVILPQTVQRQPREVRDMLESVNDVIELGHDFLPLDLAARMCNTELLQRGDQLIVFAFHDSSTLLNTIEEAKSKGLLTAALFLD